MTERPCILNTMLIKYIHVCIDHLETMRITVNRIKSNVREAAL